MSEKIPADRIEESLVDLLDAVGASSLSKAYGGVAVDQGGHVDERGQTSGGYADVGDVGKLDDMMIGKMGEALSDAGYSTDQIVAFMSQFGADDDDGDAEAEEKPKGKMKGMKGKMKGMKGRMEEEDVEEDDEDDAEKGFGDWDFAKSFADSEDIADAINVSPFLEGLVEKTTEAVGQIYKSQTASQAKQERINKSMAVAIAEMSTMLKAIGERLNVVEATPLPPRGIRNIPRGMAKSFGGGQQLNKSEVLATLSYMNLEKSIKDIGGMPTSELVGLYEAGGTLHPAAYQAAQRFLAANPSEAEAAKRYR